MSMQLKIDGEGGGCVFVCLCVYLGGGGLGGKRSLGCRWVREGGCGWMNLKQRSEQQ